MELPVTPEKFIATWKHNSLTEKGGAQPHFEDLCRLLGVDPPRQYSEYCYEQDLKKMHGGNGFADVWKRGCFAWENKGPDKDLGPALMQLKNYAGALDNPPVLVVCNRDRIEIHPCFTGYPSTPRIILLEDIGQPENLQALRWLFSPEDIHRLRPLKSNAAITAEAAGEFAKVAKAMRGRGLDSQQVAHFLIQCIFCMYAEDEGLLHEGSCDNPQIFTAILKSAREDAERATRRIASLFAAMRDQGGSYGNDDIAWFNGGLFKVVDVPSLEADELAALREAAEKLDWRAIDPTIFGTLFERGLDPDARAPLGAHYTDVKTIAKLIHPLIVEPLTAEWAAIKPLLVAAQGKSPRTAPHKAAMVAFQRYLVRLKNFRVLDPACGSGNFLYLAMHALKDLEHAAQVDAELLGFGRQIGIEAGPANILGLEINEYAAELARVTVWIGDIQWSQRNGQPIARNPILRTLDGIQHRDALITADGSEAEWPAADVIVGNPPFLGGSKKSGELGREYFSALNRAYELVVPGASDLVCYWFHKARKQILADQAQRAGLVATNSIRGGVNRKVLDAIVDDLEIFDAWSDEAWINDGAAVRVSLVCFSKEGLIQEKYLDGNLVQWINSDLSNAQSDLTQAVKLKENQSTAYLGMKKGGSFDIPGSLARQWLSTPNPNGKSSADVLFPWVNGTDIVKERHGKWIVDFGTAMSEDDAALYEGPFAHVLEHVKPERDKNNREVRRRYWWRFSETMPALRKAISEVSRYIVSARVSKHRIFSWRHSATIPDDGIVIIARADDTTFGILHSRFHELWSLGLCTFLGVGNDPRYTPSSTFETFPFPAGLTPADTKGLPMAEGELLLPPVEAGRLPAAVKIAKAAQRLASLRENWLNPAEWVDRVPDVIAGYPERIIAKPEYAAELKKRTLTNLYNARPAWLDNSHKALDQAVAEAYGWTDYTPEMSDEDILHRLLALNLERSKQ
ncbi:class I SAM-dependent DNA methyltransferase [Stutzerimonas nitrititolerans]|uniref:class I SAM-dependent DNA methyltransferase n=1 Tax=Stutzerimonas nitrititolerans TaxID=2482751 RepID=UPI001BDBD166|nr:DNA methyltransferase [Stutzerimonas nitrititolerans]MBT1121723.1 class I SAM-dependent DNA methyltransferase [Stutzerimonas nitrititolerans]